MRASLMVKNDKSGTKNIKYLDDCEPYCLMRSSNNITRDECLVFIGYILCNLHDSRSCENCNFISDDNGYEYGEPWWICVHPDPKINVRSNLRSFPFKKEQKCFIRSGWFSPWFEMFIDQYGENISEDKNIWDKLLRSLDCKSHNDGTPKLREVNKERCVSAYMAFIEKVKKE